MLEKDIEKRFRENLKKRIPKAMCLKFVSPGFSGVPDRIVLLPSGKTVFVELKRPGKVERQRQLFVQTQLILLGFTVFPTVDSFEKVDRVIDWCERAAMLSEI